MIVIWHLRAGKINRDKQTQNTRLTVISFIMRMSHNLISWSREALRNQCPFGFHVTLDTVFLCACSVCRQLEQRSHRYGNSEKLVRTE